MIKNLFKSFIIFFYMIIGFSSTFSYFGFEKVSDDLKGDIIENGKGVENGVIEMVGYLLNFLYLIAFIWIVWSGFTIMTAAGDDEKVKTGKKRILYTFIGVIVIFLAYTITISVMDGLAGIPGSTN